MSETVGEYRVGPANENAISNAQTAGDSLIGGNINALRVSYKTLATQLHKEQQAREASEVLLRDEIAALRSELETQKRMIAQLMRERAVV